MSDDVVQVPESDEFPSRKWFRSGNMHPLETNAIPTTPLIESSINLCIPPIKIDLTLALQT